MGRLTGPLLDTGRGTNRGWFAEFPLTLNPDYVVVFDDFTGAVFNATDTWTVVKDASASVAIEADAAGGRALLSSAATTENDGASIQGNEIFKPTAGKRIWFETRLKMATAAQIDLFVGLSVNFATDPEAVLAAAARIGFQIDDGGASILCKTEDGGTETSTDSTIDAVDATDIVLGFLVIGTTEVRFYVNDVLKATHTTNIPDEELALALGHISGQATGTQTVSCDYLFCAATR